MTIDGFVTSCYLGKSQTSFLFKGFLVGSFYKSFVFIWASEKEPSLAIYSYANIMLIASYWWHWIETLYDNYILYQTNITALLHNHGHYLVNLWQVTLTFHSGVQWKHNTAPGKGRSPSSQWFEKQNSTQESHTECSHMCTKLFMKYLMHLSSDSLSCSSNWQMSAPQQNLKMQDVRVWYILTNGLSVTE